MVALASLSATVGNIFQMNVFVNHVANSSLSAFKVEGTLTTAITLNGVTTVSMSAGDTLAVRIFQNTGGSISLDTDANFAYIVVNKES